MMRFFCRRKTRLAIPILLVLLLSGSVVPQSASAITVEPAFINAVAGQGATGTHWFERALSDSAAAGAERYWPGAPRHILVRDGQGQPLKRIYVDTAPHLIAEQMQVFVPQAVHDHHMDPRRGSHFMESDDSSFTVPVGVQVRDSETGRVLIEPTWTPPTEPLLVTLGTAGKIVLRIVNGKGKPIEGAMAGLPGVYYRYDWTKFQNLPKTDRSGTLVLDGLNPGVHACRVLIPRPVDKDYSPEVFEYPLVTIVAVEPGRTHELTLVFDGADSKTPIGLLTQFREQWLDRYEHTTAPTVSSKKLLANLESILLDYISLLTGAEAWHDPELRFAAKAAQAFGIQSTVPQLKAAILSWRMPEEKRSYLNDMGVQSLAEDIAALEGDKAIPFFLALAADSARPYLVRRDAVIALAHIGTEAAAEAYKKLRDTARAQPNAPSAVEDPTHAQKMTEAFLMTYFLIPGQPDDPEAPPEDLGFSVSDDYRTGQIWVHRGLGGWVIRMRRIGDAWMVLGPGHYMPG